jgi:hypothetical protein
VIHQSGQPSLPELLQPGTPTFYDISCRHSALDLLSKSRSPRQTVEVCRYPFELVLVNRSDHTQQMDRGGRGVIRGAIGYLQPDPSQGGVGILAVSRLSLVVSSQGAPTCSNGASDPRPTDRLVPSKRQLPG